MRFHTLSAAPDTVRIGVFDAARSVDTDHSVSDRFQRDLRPLSCGELEIRPDQFQAFVGGRSLGLTRREYGLIELLARADGESLSREQIYETVWGRPMPRSDRSVDVFVHKLRGKLSTASPHFLYVHTEFRFGYRLAPQPVDGALVLAASAIALAAEDSAPLQQPLAA